MIEQKEIFGVLKNLLVKHSKGLYVRSSIIGSKVKSVKPAFHLYGKKKVSILGLPERQTYVAGIIMQKHFVGFYFMPMYSHPKEVPIKNELLKRAKKGKSCLNISTLDKAALKELALLLVKGIALYRKIGWV